MKKQPKPVSSVIYRGPSLIDAKPIVVVAIVKSKNVKTGTDDEGMVQTYIMPDGISPLDASKTGRDASVCGECVHRGMPTDDTARKQAVGRTCYVNLGQGPTIVFKGLQRGIYPMAQTGEDVARLGAGRMVRLGTWGDPAAVPRGVWENLLLAARGHTGYTHNADAQPSIVDLCMVSADTVPQAQTEHSIGQRTFRVIPVQAWQQQAVGVLLKNEILCPASVESKAEGVTCVKCRLCTGSNGTGKSIAIVAHGTNRNAYK